MKKTALTLTILFLVFIQSCDVVDSISGKSDDNKVKLYPVQIDDRWGYINSDGQLQIEPDFFGGHVTSDAGLLLLCEDHAARQKGPLCGRCVEIIGKRTFLTRRNEPVKGV
jgi:hypothetical protein